MMYRVVKATQEIINTSKQLASTLVHGMQLVSGSSAQQQTKQTHANAHMHIFNPACFVDKSYTPIK